MSDFFNNMLKNQSLEEEKIKKVEVSAPKIFTAVPGMEVEEDREQDKKSFFDTLGNTYKQAYNESLGGIIHEMMTGKKYYDLTLAPPSLTRDIAAGFLSFFASKEDIGLMFASGGIGAGVAKGAVKGALSRSVPVRTIAERRAAVMLAKRGGMDVSQAKKLISNVVDVGGTQAFVLGAHDGFYDAAKEARDKMILDDALDIQKFKNKSYGEVLEEVSGNAKFSKFAGGFALGLTAGSARQLATSKLAKKIPKGLGGGLLQSGITYEAITFAGGSPLLYEGRAPEFNDMIVAGGIIGALKIAPATVNRLKKTAKQKLQDEIDTINLKRTAAEQEQQASRRTARGGRLTFTQALSTTLRGKEIVVRPPGKDGKPVKSYEKEQVLFDRAGKGEVKIVDGGITKTDKGVTMEIEFLGGSKKGKVGRQYFLNERQTEQFFKTFADSETTIGMLIQDQAGMLTQKQRQKLIKNRNVIQKFYEQEIDDYVQKTVNKRDGYILEDLNNVLTRAATEFSIGKGKNYVHPLQRAVDAGKSAEFDFKKLNSYEKRELGKFFAEEKAIRKFVLDETANNNFMYQTLGGDKGAFSSTLGPLLPFYYQLTHPVARKLNRLVNNVNRNVQQKTAGRLLKMDRVLKIARGQGKKAERFYDDYLDGFGEVNAFDDYKAIRKKTLELKEKGTFHSTNNNGYTYLQQKLRREKDRHKVGSEAHTNINNRINYLRETKFITDEIYKDAAGVLTGRIAPYEAGYAPLMYKREVLDILFDRMNPMKEKVDKILKQNKIFAENADGIYPEEVRKQLMEMVQRTVKSFENKTGKGDVQFTKVWKALRADTTRAGKDFQLDDLDLYRALDMQMYQRTLRPFSPLEAQRMQLGNVKIAGQDMLEVALRSGQEGILESNMRKLFGEYVSGASKRIELARTFTASGKYYDALLKQIPENLRMSGRRLPKAFGGQKIPLASQTEREAIDMIKQVFTGEINFNKSGTAAETFQTVANLEMIGKIALGFAVIPNLTQTFISTAVETGPLMAIKTFVNLGLGKDKIRMSKMVRESGSTILNAFDEMLMTDNALQIGAARSLKYGDATTSWTRNFMEVNNARDGIALATQKLATPFAAINKLNQTIAAATAEQSAMKLTKIVKGEKLGFGILDTLAPKQRRKWAVDKLGRMGLEEKDVIKYYDNIVSGDYSFIGAKKLGRNAIHPMKEKVLRSMQRFSTESQLQRDFILDPYLFNDPFVKPLLLFKRFGYRQATYSANLIERELVQGNVMPILNLAIGGFAGGQFVMWAKEEASKLLSGSPQYRGKETRMKTIRTPEWQDLKNALANVGSFGVMSDIMTDDDPISSIKFFMKPVMIDDFQRVVRSFDTFVGSMQTQYPDNWDVPFRKALIVGAPVAGGGVSRVVRSFSETEKMSMDRVRARKREAVRDIKDYIINGNTDAAARLMNEFNEYAAGPKQQNIFGMELESNDYLSLIITPKDVGYTAIMQDWTDRLKKIEEEKTKRN